MKFSSATLALSLLVGALSSSSAFVTPSLSSKVTSTTPATALQMVATIEIVDGAKPKKTREVG